MRRSIIARTSGRVKPGRPGWLPLLVAVLMLLLSVTALAGTPGKAYNLSLDTGTLDNRPVYAFSSLPATFKLRARVLDQIGSPVTGLTGSQLVIQGGKNCRSGTALNAGTDYTTGAFAEVGNGLFEWTVTLNPGGLSSGDIGQFEVRVTGSPATDNQWLAATVLVKHGTMVNGDVHYVEVQPAANYGAGNLKTGNPDYPFTVRFFDGNGNPLYLGEVNNTNTPSGEIYLSLFNWTQSGGVATPSGYGVNGYHNYSGTYDYHFFLLGNASYFYGLTEGLSQYVTVAARKGNFEFLIPMGLTALVNTGTGSSTAVPTFTYPSLFPATMIGNWDYTYTAYTIPPGAATTGMNLFTVRTNTGSDALTSVTVTLPTGSAGGISRMEIVDFSSVPVGSLDDPASDTPAIPLTTPVVATTSTSLPFTVRITPKSHPNMPPPPGATYLVTGKVTGISHAESNPVIISDSYGHYNTVTIDNQSPANPVGVSVIPGAGLARLNWTNPADPDLGQTVILRGTAPIADTPAEGGAYAVGDAIGGSRVACVVNAPAASCTDSGLLDATPYHYRLFARDASGNFSAGGAASGPHIFTHQTTAGTCSAVATGPTTIAVSMPYANDVDADNGYTVEYRPSGAGSWTAWVAGAPRTPSPFTATIGGLSQGSSYDVRCTWLDPDAVDGTNPQTVANVLLPDYRTAAGTAVAVAAGPTSLTVTVPYAGDANADNSYAVEYAPSGSGNWTTWVTAAPHGPSPYVATITGLDQGACYDVRVTYLDSDGVTGSNPVTIASVVLPDNRTYPGSVSVVPLKPTMVELTASFASDANANGTVTVEYRVTGEDAWSTFAAAVPRPSTPYVTPISGLQPNSAYEVKVTYLDPDGVVGTAQQIAYVVTPETRLLHNSRNADKKGYWSQYGGWGLPSTQYGEFTCLTCHEKRTTNAGGIKRQIRLNPLPPSTNFGGTVIFAAPTGTKSFGDDSAARPVPPLDNKICEVCHTLTVSSKAPYGALHRQVQTDIGNHANANGKDCTSCHTHDTGFKSPW